MLQLFTSLTLTVTCLSVITLWSATHVSGMKSVDENTFYYAYVASVYCLVSHLLGQVDNIYGEEEITANILYSSFATVVYPFCASSFPYVEGVHE